ncbi:MAG TPA: multiheme c-type cytochrome [Ferruginibacter sp.]|nr:multiheme c-type cytochrome [Ferruginibacter sp.]
MKQNRRSILIISTLSLFIIFLSQCIHKTEAFNDLRGQAFAGSGTCRQCHQAIYDSVLLSAHFNATAPASKENVHGNFNAGSNSFVYDKDTRVVMEDRDSGLYQVVYINGKEKGVYRFDITFGLRNAQTWLYWLDDKTYELPVSYYTSVHTWATSPGFSARQPDFKRFIGRDCFECHSSNIRSELNASTAGISEVLVKSSLIYGIDCERCHGPAAGHVNYHIEYPEIKTAKHIISIKSLGQQQKLDMCAVCHSGNDKLKIESRFKFRPGDTLANFFMASGRTGTSDFDVHGNQYRLMSESKCILVSKKMNCSSCHNPHTNANNDLAVYSQKCMSCHTQGGNNFCPMADSIGPSIKNNCIDCHMPEKPSEAISFRLPGNSQTTSYLLRTHRIATYPVEAKDKKGTLNKDLK